MSSNEHYKFPSTVKHRAYWHYRNASNVFDRLPRGKPEKPFEVYDLETTTDLTRVYLAGWYDGREYRYFESLPLPPDSPGSAVDQFCRWYFARKPMGAIYAHNGGNFDHLYILRWLLRFEPHACIEFVPTQSSILLMTVSNIGPYPNSARYEFRDSMRLMVAGLDDIAKTLLGQGKVTGIDYETLHKDPRRYEYLKRDCVALYDCITKFRSIVVDKLRGAMGVTAAATAIATLRTSYLPRSIKALSTSRETFVRRGYYGGRTEVFHSGNSFPVTTPLRCYDVNSMYVWALSQPLPVDYCLETRGQWPEKAIGFLECEVDTENCNQVSRVYPILPYRHEGKLLFPRGRFRGVWATPELELALMNGYRIRKKGRGVWFRCLPLFRYYVDMLYKLRDKGLPTYDPTLSAIAKVLGNATYGKFGTNREREKIWLNPPIADVIDKHMRPMQGPFELPIYFEDVQCEASYVLPHLAAWVTSLSRVKLWLYVALCWPSRVYYVDTDSIYTTAQLPTGTKLGEMKPEYDNITKAEFVAPKVYRLTHADEHSTTKAKGFSSFGQKFNAFDTLNNGKSVNCSAMSKLRTVLRGDFGLIIHQKRLLKEDTKRRFLPDGSSIPWVIEHEKILERA